MYTKVPIQVFMLMNHNLLQHSCYRKKYWYNIF